MTSPAPAIDPVKLDRLAEVAIKVGLQLATGQELVMTAPVEALPLVAPHHRARLPGRAVLVTTLFSDDEATLARYRMRPTAASTRRRGWLFDGMAKAFRGGAARLAIVGDEPVAAGRRRTRRRSRAPTARDRWPIGRRSSRSPSFDINWTIVAYATPGLGRSRCSRTSREDVAVASSGDAIFAASRVDGADPVAAWKTHNAALHARTGLAERAALRGAALPRPGHRPDRRPRRRPCLGRRRRRPPRTASPATPTSRPRRCSPRRTTARVDGHVRSTKPLSYQGTLIQDIARPLRGRARSSKPARRSGEAVLAKVLDTDEGARRLGEVALVPHSSPISQQRAAVLQHPVRRERRQPHRARPVPTPSASRRRRHDAGELAAARRQPEPDPYRLDDRLGRDRLDGLAEDGRASR